MGLAVSRKMRRSGKILWGGGGGLSYGLQSAGAETMFAALQKFKFDLLIYAASVQYV